MPCWVSPEAKDIIAWFADKEDRDPGQVVGIITEWAAQQLLVSEWTHVLKSWKAVPADTLDGLNGVREHVRDELLPLIRRESARRLEKGVTKPAHVQRSIGGKKREK